MNKDNPKEKWMKAITYKKYGEPTDVLELREVKKPEPKENEVLVKVHAASVNMADLAFVRGKPFLIRMMGSGLFRPKNEILGMDIAGQVESVGANCEHLQPGEDVYGEISECGWGGFAEYVCVPEDALVSKPVNLTHQQAAAVPQASVVALQGLRDHGRIHAGQKVLINGASGGIGTFAVQIAKSFGAEVTGVCSTRNIDFVRSIGAGYVIDYTKEDFTKSRKRYDLILDIVASRPMAEIEPVLTPAGSYVLTGGDMSRIIQVSMSKNKQMKNFTAMVNQEDLVYMKELIESGKVVPVIDKEYPLWETPQAIQYYGERLSRGKIIITIEKKEKENG
jgi:NADPH:quinone reductase-like Zn-dependent oxidoreductase